MSKAVKLLLPLAACILLITACGKKTEDKAPVETPVETQMESTVALKDTMPSEKTILNDINKSDIVKLIFNETTYTLNANSVSIIKGSIDKGNSTIYCTINQDNQNYACSTELILYYKYYDVGGWIIDKYDTQKRTVKPVGVMSKDLADAYMNYTNYKNIEYVSASDTVDADGSCIYTYKAEIPYTYMVEKYTISLKCTFNTTYGWVISINNTSMVEDWSKTCGVWSGKASSGVETFKITIASIDTTKSTCNYEYTYTSSPTYILNGNVNGLMAQDNYHYYNVIDCKYIIENKDNYMNNFEFYLGKNEGIIAVHDNNNTTYFVTKN
ncbi:hypothetical protein [[Clostridium] fimetarium]|uniref:Ig-like domain-containing protein n=1 Tax=[Clostridium] fimetarium TaxID=99656 RepID=A0A1I0MXT9_9FIRM|nr:hypothetical protein [[Clostridium] fimetarium]SEV93596.1 hypothetical protein SAMN05421659_102237 [[Clostridium] fimetarium]